MSYLIPNFLSRVFVASSIFLSFSVLGFTAESVKFVQEFVTGLSHPVDVTVSLDGTVYVLDDQIARVFVFDSEGNPQLDFGRRGAKADQMMMPKSLAISPQGKIFVADTGHHRIQVFNSGGEFLFDFGQMGVLKGQFKAPMGVAIDHLGFVFVADRENNRIQMFSPHGVFLETFATEAPPLDVAVDTERNLYVLQPEIGKIVKYAVKGRKLQELLCMFNNQNFIHQAKGLTVDQYGEVYITEGAEHSIKKIDRRNVVLLSFGSEGSGRGQFRQATGIFAKRTGQIYVADTDNRRVEAFKIISSPKEILSLEKNSPSFVDFDTTLEAQEALMDVFSVPGRGLFALSDQKANVFIQWNMDFVFGREGKNPVEFKKPMAIAATLNGKILVADTGNNRVQVFNVDGIFQYEFGQMGNKPGQFNGPQGIAINGKGKIFVADTNNHRIQVFNHEGIYLRTVGEADKGQDAGARGVVRGPMALAMDSLDQLYVLEPPAHRLQIFNEKGQYIGMIGEKGSGPGQFDNPVDIAIDENDNLYVADQGNSRIQIFSPKRKFLLSFGAMGEDPFCFKKITGLTASEGRIIVTDYLSRHFKVFRYFVDGIVKVDRVYSTKTASPPTETEENDVYRYTLARLAAQKKAVGALAESLGLTEQYLKSFLRIESVEALNDGQVKVTVSVPKGIATSVFKKTSGKNR